MDALQTVLAFAAKHDLPFDEVDAALYLKNRAALANQPTDAEAKRIARHFECVFFFAKDDLQPGDFVNAPECPNDCPECTAHNDRYLARMNERFKRYLPKSNASPEEPVELEEDTSVLRDAERQRDRSRSREGAE